MYLLDSNIYIGLSLSNDALHQKSFDIYTSLWSDQYIVVPYSIFTETITVLTYKSWKKLAMDFVDFLEEDDRFLFREDKGDEAFDFWLWVDRKMWYTDIAIVHIATSMWLELISLDKQVMSLYQEFLW